MYIPSYAKYTIVVVWISLRDIHSWSIYFYFNRMYRFWRRLAKGEESKFSKLHYVKWGHNCSQEQWGKYQRCSLRTSHSLNIGRQIPKSRFNFAVMFNIIKLYSVIQHIQGLCPFRLHWPYPYSQSVSVAFQVKLTTECLKKHMCRSNTLSRGGWTAGRKAS